MTGPSCLSPCQAAPSTSAHCTHYSPGWENWQCCPNHHRREPQMKGLPSWSSPFGLQIIASTSTLLVPFFVLQAQSPLPLCCVNKLRGGLQPKSTTIHFPKRNLEASLVPFITESQKNTICLVLSMEACLEPLKDHSQEHHHCFSEGSTATPRAAAKDHSNCFIKNIKNLSPLPPVVASGVRFRGHGPTDICSSISAISQIHVSAVYYIFSAS